MVPVSIDVKHVIKLDQWYTPSGILHYAQFVLIEEIAMNTPQANDNAGILTVLPCKGASATII